MCSCFEIWDQFYVPTSRFGVIKISLISIVSLKVRPTGNIDVTCIVNGIFHMRWIEDWPHAKKFINHFIDSLIKVFWKVESNHVYYGHGPILFILFNPYCIVIDLFELS